MAFRSLKHHKNEAVKYGAIAIGVIVLIVGYTIYSRGQHSNREQALAAAIRVQEAPVGVSGNGGPAFPSQEAKDQETIRVFTDLQTKYSGSAEGEIAQYYLGSIKADQGKLAEAEKLYQEVAQKGDEKYASLAKFSLAQIYFADGRADQGEKLLRDLIAHPTVFVSADQATIYAGSLPGAKDSPLRHASYWIHYAVDRETSDKPLSPCWPNCHRSSRRRFMLARLRFPVERSRGRRYPEPEHPYRNAFQRDRDRVVHSRAFRRLEAKTQVFTPGLSDHFRNRLTHTIEVAQIARTLANVLRLDEDLTEALALAHDIGHPPFAHAGEEALNAEMQRFGERFEHNLHALRIVESFEQRYARFPGLNLSFEVREGIVKHSHDFEAGRERPGGCLPARICARRWKRN